MSDYFIAYSLILCGIWIIFKLTVYVLVIAKIDGHIINKIGNIGLIWNIFSTALWLIWGGLENFDDFPISSILLLTIFLTLFIFALKSFMK